MFARKYYRRYYHKHLWYCPLQWRHMGRDGVSNHQLRHCLLNGLFRLRSKKTSKLCVTGLCVENSPVTGEFPAHIASTAENVSIGWRHRDSEQMEKDMRAIFLASHMWTFKCCTTLLSSYFLRSLHFLTSGGQQEYLPLLNGHLTKYVKFGVAHAPGMPGTFSPLPISKETAT